MVYISRYYSLVLPGQWTKATAVMQRCSTVLIVRVNWISYGWEFCEQYCQDATCGLPGHWKIIENDATMDTLATSRKRPASSPLNAEACQSPAIASGASLRPAFYARPRACEYVMKRHSNCNSAVKRFRGHAFLRSY